MRHWLKAAVRNCEPLQPQCSRATPVLIIAVALAPATVVTSAAARASRVRFAGD